MHFSSGHTTIAPQPTTLSGRAALRLADGPLDPITLMREVCQVQRLQADAAERMAVALLGTRPEFIRLPSGHWALRSSLQLELPYVGSSGEGLVRETVSKPYGVRTSAYSAAPGATHTPLSSVAFAVVDVETTGTSSKRGDRITEIAIATVQGGALSDVYVRLVNPDRLIPASITALTNITWAMVKDQPRFSVIAPDVTERLAGRVFTAHNATFDWRFVSDELARGMGHRLYGPRLCTVRLARMLLPALTRRSLDHVTRYFGVNIEGRHRAGGDAEATAKVLLRMLDVAGDRGIESWEALLTLVSKPSVRRARMSRRQRALPHSVTDDHIA